ncbi:MAG: FtsK/SpoIIIE domain-containing protein, partial [Frankia sp.]
AVRVDDPGMPERAARVTVGVDGSVTLGPFPGEPVGRVEIERETLSASRPVAAGEQIAIGDVLLEIGPPTAPDAAVRPSDDGVGLDFNRPPRLLPPERTTSFRLPMEPSAPDRRPLPILMAVLPVVASGGMAVLFHQYYYLMFALISPLTIVGSHVSGKRQGRRTHRTQMAQYKRLRAEITAAAQAALATERTARRSDCPDPAAVLLLAAGPRQRLWERRRHDPDRLLLRLGTADLPSEVTCDDPNVEEHRRESTWRAPDVPVTVSLPDRGVLGVAGRDGVARVLGCWLVAQAAVLHSPRDLSIYVLTDSSGRESWEWVRWLPHTRPVDGQDTAVLLGTDADSWGRRVGELGAQIAARVSARGDLPGGSTIDAPDVLVVLDGARRLRSLPGMITVLRDGPAVGIYTICLDTDERLLPEECQAVAAQTRGGRLRVGQMRADVVPDVRPDLIATGGGRAFDARAAAVWCERVARALAPVRDGGQGADPAIPATARLLDVLNLEPPTSTAVAGRWTVAPRSTEAVVGVSLDGPFALDLRRHGPHGLIAGTTGSGKSELLQTIVAALAVANRPDAMTFVLIDYKGGSAFADCVALPHTVGMVTDLDTHLVERALASLSAELRRREHILADAGAKDIEDYTLRVAAGELAPLPRLLLVIDEFASMARELPDFVTGLVNIAQRGRSLGIHLLLATQRPSGVVSPEIRANTNLRIALRVTDTGESVDVIDAPDAGRISPSTPGRAYVRLGHGSLVPFQAGRVGGRRPVNVGAGSGSGSGSGSAGGGVAGAAGGAAGRVGDGPGATGPDPDAPAPWFTELDWTGLSRPAPMRPRAAAAPVDEVTDLKVLVEAVREAADQLAVPPQHSPWLP